MQLKPVTETTLPTYPVRTGKDSAFGQWVRRAMAAACATGAIWLGGCYGATPYHERPDEPQPISDIVTIMEVVVEQPPIPVDPEPMDGGMMAPAFGCGELQEWNVRTAPDYLDGALCDDVPALAGLEITEAATYTVSISSGWEYTFLSIRDPAGVEVAELTPDQPSVVVDFTEGRWTLVATPADPINNANSWFSLSVNL